MHSGPPPPWSYTRKQRYGLLLLVAGIGLVYCLSAYLTSEREPTRYDNAALLAAAAELTSAPDSEPNRAANSAAENFSFDPNTVSAADLRRLGLSEKQTASFIKFRNARAFRRPEELKNLYVLRPEQADRLVELARITPKEVAAGSSAAPAAPPTAPPETFAFDPNTISADSLVKLGFTQREATTILKYRSYRPMTFRKPEDLLRVTSVNQQRIRELLPSIQINLPSETAEVFAPPTPQPIDINTATVADWQRLPGIGPYRARKIVAFREKLGGFVSVAQVGTTYGLPDTSFHKIVSLLEITTPRPGLYINRMSADELSSHPYLRRQTAQIIVRYRQNHGPFTSAEELKKVRALSTENLERLLPYLNFAP